MEYGMCQRINLGQNKTRNDMELDPNRLRTSPTPQIWPKKGPRVKILQQQGKRGVSENARSGGRRIKTPPGLAGSSCCTCIGIMSTGGWDLSWRVTVMFSSEGTKFSKIDDVWFVRGMRYFLDFTNVHVYFRMRTTRPVRVFKWKFKWKYWLTFLRLEMKSSSSVPLK